MAFSTRVKNELARFEPPIKCCKIAELSAILKTCGSLHIRKGGYAFHATSGNAAVARNVVKSFKTLYHLQTEVTTRRSFFRRANSYVIHIPVQDQLPQVLNELGILNHQSLLEYSIPPRLFKNKSCRTYFLRGAFLGAGFLSDPKGEYHFELVLKNYELAASLTDLFHELNLPAKLTYSRKKHIVYLTGSEHIIRFLALIGAHKALLDWEDARTLKEVRNQVNRGVNCDTANLDKTVEAALGQLRDIALIEEEVGILSLYKSLQEIVSLRKQHPYASISELGEAHSPSLSKSAVYHRIRRLSRIADGLRAAS